MILKQTKTKPAWRQIIHWFFTKSDFNFHSERHAAPKHQSRFGIHWWSSNSL